MSVATGQKIVLAGRVFVPVGESTIEHDIEVMRLLRAAGLEISEGAEPNSAAAEAQGLDVLAALVNAGALLPLVACLIVPEESARRRPGAGWRLLERLGLVRHEATHGGWTRELQDWTVEYLRRLDEPEDKQRVYGVVAQLLFPFVSGARRSWRLSRRSSGTGTLVAPARGGPHPSAGATFGPGVN